MARGHPNTGPTVVDGVRGPTARDSDPGRGEGGGDARDLGTLVRRARGEPEAPEPEAVPGKRRFNSRNRGHQLTIQIDREIKVNGIVIPAVNKTVGFEFGLYETTDPTIIAGILASRSWRNGDVWDADERHADDQRKRVQSFIGEVQALPEELKGQLREALGTDDFQVEPEPATAG
jgi:hypothetical protein